MTQITANDLASKTVQVEAASPETVCPEFTAMVEKYEGPLLRYAAHLFHPDRTEAEDVVQETFLRLLRQIRASGAESIKSPSTWLFRVAHNLSMDGLRKRTNRESSGEHLALLTEAVTQARQSHSGGLGELERNELQERAVSELHNLPESQRSVVLLKIMEGMSLREISRVTGLSVGNAGHRMNQGLLELSRRLKAAGVV
jgi:RNA polymerase sigma-70 factor (ECF subfamily)